MIPALLATVLSLQTPAAPACRTAAFDDVAFYAGRWQVTIDARLSREGPWEKTPGTSLIEPQLMGCALVERLDTTRQDKPLQLLSFLTYDQHASAWQFTVTDSEHGRVQTYEGRMDRGVAPLFTTIDVEGGSVRLRRTLARESADAFHWESARSLDGGKTWDVTTRFSYRRIGAPQPRPEAVTIPVNGAVLAGQYVDAGSGAPGVLFFPMCREDAMDGWAPVAERLRGAGVSSLTIAYRGYGASTGASMPRMPLDASMAYWRDTWGPDADAALAFLRSRIGVDAPVVVAGSSCGVYMSLLTAARHPAKTRGVVLLSGPYGADQAEFLRRTPALSVFSAASAGDGPTAQWAQALRRASEHPASEVKVFDGRMHGTDLLAATPTLAGDIASWIAQRLR